MNPEQLSLASEIKMLEELLAQTPEDNLIERMSLEARLKSVESELNLNNTQNNPIDLKSPR